MKNYFVKDDSGAWQACLESDLIHGQLYRLESNGRSLETYWSAPQPRNQVKITGIMKNGTLPMPLANRAVIKEGESLGVTARFQTASGELLQVTDLYGMPIYQLGGIVAQTVGVQFYDGTAQILVSFPDSGEYVVTAEGLNLHLPEGSKIDFDSFYISVLKAD